MKCLVNECTPQEWDTWLASQPHAAPTQTWAWQQAQEAAGKTTLALRVVQDDNAVLAQALCLIEPAPAGKVLVTSPRGPVIAHDSLAVQDAAFYAAVLQCMREAVREHVPNAVLWRCEPTSSAIDEARMLHVFTESLMQAGARRIHDKQPAVTRMLGLHVPAEELLAAMKQKTRYNIRLSEKKDVHTEWHERATTDNATWQKLVEQWIALQNETAARQGIRTHGDAYYHAVLGAAWPAGTLHIGVARAGEHGHAPVLAMNIQIAFGDTMTYLYGASTDAQKERMAPYALQWSAIQLAKEAGKQYYDFYGIAPAGAAATHPLAGVTRFKEGFGGMVMQYAGTWEFPISRLWYTMYRGIKLLKHLRP